MDTHALRENTTFVWGERRCSVCEDKVGQQEMPAGTESEGESVGEGGSTEGVVCICAWAMVHI